MGVCLVLETGYGCCGVRSVSGTGDRIWMRHTQTARVAAGEVCLVLDTEYG
jgi:hypothetical protein